MRTLLYRVVNGKVVRVIPQRVVNGKTVRSNLNRVVTNTSPTPNGFGAKFGSAFGN